MDAIKFLAERQRMCDTYYNSENEECSAECPATGIQCVDMRFIHENASEEELVACVERWSAAHPRKTRQDLFLEQWPNAEIDCQGVIVIDPCDIDKTTFPKEGGCYNVNCDECRREFWMQEVK